MPPTLFGADQFATVSAQLLLHLWQYINHLDIPLPIGLIGAWRWGVWMLRRIIGLWYRARNPNNFRASTAVITPVYNEEPDLFRAALRSWAANQPDEIIAVVDHTDTDCMEQFRQFEVECVGSSISLQMLITQTPGKRPALADGILAAKSEIVFLVDSDTIWDPDVLPKSLAPFTEAEVGGVTVRQRVLDPHSTAQRLFDVYLDIRYIDEIRFLTAFGDAVTCLSGRTAVYRRAVALTALEDLMEETFWGRQVISGDDKALTLAVQSRGWKVRYQGNTCVYTPGATEMKTFLKQRLRWARNSWRADLKALGSGWAWRKPMFAFHLLDRLLQPLTTLVAPLYFGFALYQQKWEVMALLVGWWSISRTIKIWPHIERRWTNIRILPWYIFFNYWSAVMKIYAFFTMNQQGWITRWSRGGKAQVWLKSVRAAPSYLATAGTVTLVALFIQSLHETPALADDTVQTPVAIADTQLAYSVPSDQPTVAMQPRVLQLTPRRGVMSVAGSADTMIHPEILDSNAHKMAEVDDSALPLTADQRQVCIMGGKAAGVCMPYRVAPSSDRTLQPFFARSEQLWNNIDHWWSDRTGNTIMPKLICATINGQEESCIQYKLQ